MCALHEPGPAVTGPPAPQPPVRPTDQLEQRAVEASGRGSLTTDDRHNIMYSSTATVLQLLESSAHDFAPLMEIVNRDEGATTSGRDGGAAPGQQVDVYA
jgi:hypothetical protein